MVYTVKLVVQLGLRFVHDQCVMVLRRAVGEHEATATHAVDGMEAAVDGGGPPTA